MDVKLPVHHTSGCDASDNGAAPTSNASSSHPGSVDPIFFWKDSEENGYLCQWYKCSFIDPTNTSLGPFNCAEQWMMYHKALLFDDRNMASQIMKTTTPGKQKGLGGKVQNFDQTKWKAARFDIVEKGNFLKFSQCTNVASMKVGEEGDPQPLRDILLSTGNRDLVEASPHDRIWGIGFSADEALNVSRAQWGENLLGKALMKVRELLQSENRQRFDM